MQTLEQLHKASGLTWREVAGRMAEFESEEARHPTSVGKILSRGTDKLTILEALSFAYSLSLAEVRAASDASKAAKKNLVA